MAVVVVVVLVAIGNTAAKKRQERAALAAADRVEATLLTAAGDTRDHAFDVTLVIVNRGRLPITVKAGRRVVPSLYDATPWLDRVLAPGATDQVDVPFVARCSGQPVDATELLSLVVPIASSSGRVRDVSTPLEPTMMWDLSRRACGYLSSVDAVDATVRFVSASQYAVHFTMLLRNRSDRRIDLTNLTSPGLAMAVMDGLPTSVDREVPTVLAVAAALPACSRLPVPGARGRGGELRFGTIVLELRDETGAQETKPYLPNADLSAALAALRARICPGSLVPPSGTRPRGF